MIKRTLIYSLVATAILLVAYSLHIYLLNNSKIPFSLLSTYLFHAISSVIVYVIIEFVYARLPNQAGYAYLATVFLKAGFFVFIFRQLMSSLDVLPISQRAALIIPMFLFLILEAIFLARLLVIKE
ncbi:MAG: DUF6168 family protein [Cyclobacteriaceae bacterium]